MPTRSDERREVEHMRLARKVDEGFQGEEEDVVDNIERRGT